MCGCGWCGVSGIVGGVKAKIRFFCQGGYKVRSWNYAFDLRDLSVGLSDFSMSVGLSCYVCSDACEYVYWLVLGCWDVGFR